MCGLGSSPDCFWSTVKNWQGSLEGWFLPFRSFIFSKHFRNNRFWSPPQEYTWYEMPVRCACARWHFRSKRFAFSMFLRELKGNLNAQKRLTGSNLSSEWNWVSPRCEVATLPRANVHIRPSLSTDVPFQLILDGATAKVPKSSSVPLPHGYVPHVGNWSPWHLDALVSSPIYGVSKKKKKLITLSTAHTALGFQTYIC